MVKPIDSRVIGIFSAKGGVGKTTSTLLLGMALSKIGKDVLVVDGNISSPNIANWLGISPDKHFHGAVNNEYPILEAVFPHETGLLVIPGSSGINYLTTLDLFSIEPIIQRLKDYSEIILIDTPPGRGEEVAAIARGVDEAIIIVNPEEISIDNGLMIKELLKKLNRKILGVIVVENKKYPRKIDKKKIAEKIGERIIGYIPFNKDILKAAMNTNPVMLSKPKKIWNAYLEVAARILGPTELERMLREDKKNPYLRYIKKNLGLK